jgi:hypothetical protein
MLNIEHRNFTSLFIIRYSVFDITFRGLHVKPKVHNIAILHNIGFTLNA